MAARRNEDAKPRVRRRPPATTPEARENQLISLAVNLAEQQLEEGTASSQVITHFLRLGSSENRLQQEKLAMDLEYTNAKMEAMAAHGRLEDLMTDALNAMKSYKGAGSDDLEGDFDE